MTEPPSADWLDIIQRGGSALVLPLFGALIWMNKERLRLLQEIAAKDAQIGSLSERVIAIIAKIEVLLFNGGGHKGL